MDDEGLLIRRVIDRQPEAEEEFVRRYRGLILGLARGRFGLAENAAQEMLQTTIAKLWEEDLKALRAWRGHGKFTTYLTVIVTHLHLRERKKERHRLEEPMDLAELQHPDPMAKVDSQVTREERLRLVAATARGLSARDRLVLALRFGDERSPKEMSGVLGMAPGTVRKAVHDALARLRRKLSDKQPELFDQDSAKILPGDFGSKDKKT